MIIFLGRECFAPIKVPVAELGKLWPEGQIQLPLFLQIKFSWDTVICICLGIVYDCFQGTMQS